MKDPTKNTAPAVLLAIPVEVMVKADIGEGDLIAFSATDGRIVIERVDDALEYDCDGDCESCPVDQTDCDNNCDNCPCQDRCAYSNTTREVE